MITETLRVMAGWWSHATYGVNALRTSVPLGTGDVAPAAVQVFASYSDARIARGDIPSIASGQLPALLVSPADQSVEMSSPGVRPFPPDAFLTVLARFAMSGDASVCERDTSVYLRALWRSTGLLFTTSAGETARKREQVQVIAPESMRLAALYESNSDTIITGGVLVTLRVRDLWAVS